jgi:Ctr copper transporter family
MFVATYVVYMVPESAIIQKDPPRTLAQMKASLTLSLSSNLDDHNDEAADSISIGCGSVPISRDELEMSRRLPQRVISRRRLQHVGGPEDCNNSTNFFCWMSCLDIPDVDKAEDYEKAGYSLYCLDPSVLALSGSTLSQAVEECPYGVHNAKCLGSWQFTVPGIPSTTVKVKSNDKKQEPYCYGGTSMYMDGFHWKDSVCIIYLFPSWILNSPSKFAAGALGSLFVGGLLEWIIMRRRTVLTVMSPGRSRLFAAAAYYGAQLSLGYLAMLVAMTYSWPLFICIILGIVSGHILFNAKDSLFPVKAYPPKSDSVAYNPGVENGNCCSTSPEQSTAADSKEESPKEIPEGSTPCCQYSL